MKELRLLHVAFLVSLSSCGDSAGGTTSAKPAPDSAKPAAMTTTSATTVASAPASAKTGATATAVASTPSATTISSAPKVVSSTPPPPALDKKAEDDLMAQMMGDSSAKPKATAAPASAPPASAPPSDQLADAFAGKPDASIKIGKTLKGGGFTIDIPDGWDATDKQYDGMVNGSSKDKGTAFVLYANGSPATDANVTTWLRAPADVDTDSVKWQPSSAFKLGGTALDGKIAKGGGKAGAPKKEDADLTYFLIGDGSVFLSTVTKKSASDRDRAELVACVRSLRK